MEETINSYRGMPQFMWEGIFSIIVTLGTGLIIAFVTSFYLNKKDEITRVSGVILEKRVNSEQEMLDYLEKLSFHLELHNGKEKEWYELLTSYELTLPHGQHLQYSDAFSSVEKFRDFFKGFEEVISRNKLWMGKKVRFHLSLMQVARLWSTPIAYGDSPHSHQANGLVRVLEPLLDYFFTVFLKNIIQYFAIYFRPTLIKAAFSRF